MKERRMEIVVNLHCHPLLSSAIPSPFLSLSITTHLHPHPSPSSLIAIISSITIFIALHLCLPPSLSISIITHCSQLVHLHYHLHPSQSYSIVIINLHLYPSPATRPLRFSLPSYTVQLHHCSSPLSLIPVCLSIAIFIAIHLCCCPLSLSTSIFIHHNPSTSL